jgi:hypothetical protein
MGGLGSRQPFTDITAWARSHALGSMSWLGRLGHSSAGSRDRITDTEVFYENDQSGWWLTTLEKTYFSNDIPTATVVARTRKRVSGFSGALREEIRSRDAEGESEGKDVVRTVSYRHRHAHGDHGHVPARL